MFVDYLTFNCFRTNLYDFIDFLIFIIKFFKLCTNYQFQSNYSLIKNTNPRRSKRSDDLLAPFVKDIFIEQRDFSFLVLGT